MHIGLIGGIGPAATIAYYERLVYAFRQANLPLDLTIAHADISVLGANARADRREAQAEVFADHLRQLKGAGCDVAGITAITGHFCFEETEALSPLPLVSAIDPIDRYCAAEGIGAIGVLGSPVVMASRLFGQLQQTATIVPETDVEDLGEAYMDMALSGVCSEPTRQRFFKAGSEMVTRQNADAVLLAGTDLGLAFDGGDPGYRIVDALSIHVDELVKLSRG